MKSSELIKYAAVVIEDGKYLVVKARDKDFFMNLGGKIEEGESPEECLKREVTEELGVGIVGTPEYYFSTPPSPAADNSGRTIVINLYKVLISGEPKPSSEIEKLHWLSWNDVKSGKVKIAGQIREFIAPRLKEDGLLR